MNILNRFRRHYRYKNSRNVTYYLNKKAVTLRGGKEQLIYYFSKDQRPEGTFLPWGYRIRENPRNGFLTVRTPKMLEREKNGTNYNEEEDD